MKICYAAESGTMRALPYRADPDGPRHLVGTQPAGGHQLGPDARVDGEVGDLVDILIEAGTVTSITPTPTTGRH